MKLQKHNTRISLDPNDEDERDSNRSLKKRLRCNVIDDRNRIEFSSQPIQRARSWGASHSRDSSIWPGATAACGDASPNAATAAPSTTLCNPWNKSFGFLSTKEPSLTVPNR
ncbi:hypothetical protein ACMYSQ_005263 [Aspergillus niger]